jgi:uncharacterized membrane protein
MILLAARRQKTVSPKPPETGELAEIESTDIKEGEETTNEINGKTSMGLEPNAAGLLCYLLGWITGIIFFILEKENKFVRFHALQSIIVFGALTLVSTPLGWIPVIGGFFGFVIAAIGFVLWIVLMYKAYKGEKYKIPWAGDFAEKQVS